VRRIARSGLQRLDDHVLDLIVADAPWRAAAWFVQQTSHAFGNESCTPFANRGVGGAQLSGYLTSRPPAAAPQHDFGAHGQAMSRPAARPPAFQRRSILTRQHQCRQRPPTRRTTTSTIISGHRSRLT